MVSREVQGILVDWLVVERSEVVFSGIKLRWWAWTAYNACFSCLYNFVCNLIVGLRTWKAGACIGMIT